MKAMVLCAGMGTRLGALTHQTPKPLLRAANRSLLELILLNLRTHGFDHIAINLHFEADQIRTALNGQISHGAQIVFSEETQLLGTAGAVRKMRLFFEKEPAFLIHYGDVVTNENLSAMVEFHRQRDALLTLLVHQRTKSNSAMVLDEHNRILKFWERPDDAFWAATTHTWVNSGILLASPQVLDLIPDNQFFDWPRDVFPKLLDSGRVFAYPLSAYRIAVDSPERLEQLGNDINSGRFLPNSATNDVPSGV